MPRVTRIAGSFAIVVIVYWAYALLAVRWIEPPVDLRGDGEITDKERERGTKFVDVRLKQLEGLFPPDAWELKNPKILESDRAKLLFQELQELPRRPRRTPPLHDRLRLRRPGERRGATPPPVDHPRSARRRRAPVRPAAGPQPGQDRPLGARATQRAKSRSAATGKNPVPKTTC